MIIAKNTDPSLRRTRSDIRANFDDEKCKEGLFYQTRYLPATSSGRFTIQEILVLSFNLPVGCSVPTTKGFNIQ